MNSNKYYNRNKYNKLNRIVSAESLRVLTDPVTELTITLSLIKS